MSCTSLNLYWNDAVAHACAATGSIDLWGGGGGGYATDSPNLVN